jgi:hypothetical protein
VPDHRIRLRGGWESCRVGSVADSERLTLPTRWGSDRPERLRLTRRFGCPPLGPGNPVLLLVLEQVPGIHSIRLNEQEIPQVSPERSTYEIPLDSLPTRNVLVLEVEPPWTHGRMDAGAPEGSSDWGCIALVIRTPRDAESPPGRPKGRDSGRAPAEPL